jgi:aspartate kinase
MLVLKFGGTSVGTADRMKEVISIIQMQSSDQKLVVLSAMSGTTNALVAIGQLMYDGKRTEAKMSCQSLQDQYDQVRHDLFSSDEYLIQSKEIIDREFQLIKDLLNNAFSHVEERIIVAQGEILSTNLFHLLCQSMKVNSALLPALDFMRIDEKSEPFLERTSALLQPILQSHQQVEVLITQGYICRNHWEEVDNLQRGGSDYTATILGAIVPCEEIQIWTDIDGIHNNDPRLVEDTAPLRKLSYREAAELAYFGAKILHPTCVLPAEKMQVPLRLKYTMEPSAPGTLISAETSQRPITAIAAKDGITAINIYSHRMLMAYGFMKKVFQVFEDHKTPIDMITTSEVAVSLTIDDNHRLDRILEDVGQFAEIEAVVGYSIICIVGNDLYNNTQNLERIFQSLRDFPVRMVSLGGSKYNVSILIKTEYKKQALIALNSVFNSLPVIN